VFYSLAHLIHIRI